MTLELIISLVGALFGSGGLVLIFMAGRRTGVLEESLKNTTTSLQKLAAEVEGVKSSARNEAGATTKDVTSKHDELRRNLLAAINSSEIRQDEKIASVHKRIDKVIEDLSDAKQQIQVTISGLQGQRTDWDQLKQDIRSLLRSEAAAQESKEIIKHTLTEHGIKIDAQNEKVAALKADLSRLLRLEAEYDRLKEEITRLQSHRS